MIPVKNIDREAPQVIGRGSDVVNFGIEVSAEAYRILSDLYSNKPMAILRELSTNANDSNIEAGKPDTPIDVYLPTELEPSLKICDSGVGMDRETLTVVYGTYFKSTKKASNDFNGAMGLGSKSPLNYTDTMIVTSIKDGEKTVAAIYLNDEGIPGLNVINHSFDCDEENGTTISLGVKRADVHSFQREAIKVYSAFSITPNIHHLYDHYREEFNGLLDKLDKSLTINLGGGVVAKIHNTQPYNNNYINIVMSNVVYPVDGNMVNEYGENTKMWDSVTLYVPNGSVGFTPSREALEYTNHTKAFLNKIFKELNDKYLNVLIEEFKKVDTIEKFTEFRDDNRKALTRGFEKYYEENVSDALLDNIERFFQDLEICVNDMQGNQYSKTSGFRCSFSKSTSNWNNIPSTPDDDSTKTQILEIFRRNYNGIHSIIPSGTVILSDKRFNKRNFADEFRGKTPLIFVQSEKMYNAMMRFHKSWYNTDDVVFMKASEVFEKEIVKWEDIKTQRVSASESFKIQRFKDFIDHMIDCNEGKKFYLVIASKDNHYILDGNFTIPQSINDRKTLSVHNVVSDLDNDEFKAIYYEGLMEFRAFRKSDHWDDYEEYFATQEDLEKRIESIYKYALKNRHVIVKKAAHDTVKAMTNYGMSRDSVKGIYKSNEMTLYQYRKIAKAFDHSEFKEYCGEIDRVVHKAASEASKIINARASRVFHKWSSDVIDDQIKNLK